MQIHTGRSVKLVNLAAALALTVVFVGTETSVTQEQKAPSPKPAAAARSDKMNAADNSAIPNEIIIGNGTANTIPVFTNPRQIHNSLITQTGNGINVAGAVNAVAFTGNGAALTNVPAVQLGGLPASAFAQTGAPNTFTADQTINGNLNLTGNINDAFSPQGNLTDANGQQGANVLGGFLGAAASGGNSIAPGVIGATIGGGGGIYDPSLVPQTSAIKKPAMRSQILGRSGQRNPFLRPERQGGTSESAERQNADGKTLNLNLGYNQILLGGDWSTVAGGLSNTASGYAATVGGGENNGASASEATVSGGSNNTASDIGSAVGGGYYNTASGSMDETGAATVAGGAANQATADYATVGGGWQNNATGPGATIAGGSQNQAAGINAFSAGELNSAAGNVSFAAGCNSTASYTGSFVWNSALVEGCFGETFLQDSGPGQFVVDAYGGFSFYTSANSTATGATLPAGSGSWSSLSDRNVKANFLTIDPSSLLQKLAAMPISTWNYKTQDESIRHLGPTAQDFHDAFGLGEDDKHISTVDAQGVAMAGIQALYQTVMQLKQNLADKDRELADLRARLANLEQSTSRK